MNVNKVQLVIYSDEHGRWYWKQHAVFGLIHGPFKLEALAAKDIHFVKPLIFKTRYDELMADL